MKNITIYEEQDVANFIKNYENTTYSSNWLRENSLPNYISNYSESANQLAIGHLVERLPDEECIKAKKIVTNRIADIKKQIFEKEKEIEAKKDFLYYTEQLQIKLKSCTTFKDVFELMAKYK